jgi:hypothetical protein
MPHKMANRSGKPVFPKMMKPEKPPRPDAVEKNLNSSSVKSKVKTMPWEKS